MCEEARGRVEKVPKTLQPLLMELAFQHICHAGTLEQYVFWAWHGGQKDLLEIVDPLYKLQGDVQKAYIRTLTTFGQNIWC